MNKATTIDRATLAAVRETTLAAINAALAPFGIVATPGRSTYTNGATGALKSEIQLIDAEPERDNFARCADLVGLKPEDYGREFEYIGERYRLSGINLNRPKFPISAARCTDGKGFKFPERLVARLLAGAPTNAG